MKVIMNLSKKEVSHLTNCSSHYDACNHVSSVINKIKKQLPKPKSLWWSTKRVPKIVKIKWRKNHAI